VRLTLDLSPADIGARVVIRYADPEGGFRDLLGELLAWGPAVTVQTRSGPVTVPADAVRGGKRVPPPPAPRNRR
jgi:hypothetical protein